MSEPGELVDEREDLARRAREVEADIIKGCRAIRTFGGVYLAAKLHEFTEQRMHEVLGYETQAEFLASPDIELAPSTVKNMVTVYRALVVERAVPTEELQGVDLRKLQIALPAVVRAEVPWQDAVADAKSLGRMDMARRYAGDPNAKLDAEVEPEKARCEACGSWVDPERLDDAV